MSNVSVYVLEFAGDGDYGSHWFVDVPQLGSIVHIDDGLGHRVIEVHYSSADENISPGTTFIYVQELK